MKKETYLFDTHALIFWNNDTDAGVQTQTFTISGASTLIPLSDGGGGDGGSTKIVTGLDPLLVLTISLIIIIGTTGSLSSYIVYKKIKTNREEHLQKLHNKFRDILSLNYIMVLEKKSGLNVYEQFIAGKDIDPTLVSGFLEAVRSFGIELTGSHHQSQIIKLEYFDSKILMSEFKNFRLILILREVPSDDFLESIASLSYDIDHNYGKQFEKFKGKVVVFDGIKDLIEKNLNISFTSRLFVVEPPNVILNLPLNSSEFFDNRRAMLSTSL